MTIEFQPPIPVLRIFDLAKADDFYFGWLGFSRDWQAELAPGSPLYLQISRGPIRLHLSEHHGDGTPGSVVYVGMRGIEAFHAEIMARPYRYNRPGLIDVPWGGRELHVIDPFHNQIRFHEA
jgi:catechol 2,3-dioxygenase-like lactoylglutathione lyase family enzyme